ncbi:MAG: PLP-dependent aminotransferase family protein [Candidatus Obscuribacterales bacterium]|nr:PLP-dependent aminotransferase family protein [Candidatus Obscuribacterales bacterium]
MESTLSSFLDTLKSLSGENQKTPIYQRLTDGFKKAIDELALMPGLALPSTRELAKYLELSRSTIVRCYEDLLAQGYIETYDGIGTFVRRKSKESKNESREQAELKLSQTAKKMMTAKRKKLFVHDFPEMNFGCAPAELLPIKIWRQLLLKNCREFEFSKLDYGKEPFGYPPLRKALLEYLRRARAVQAELEQLIVFPSALYGLHLLSNLLSDQSTIVVMSDPGFAYARETFKNSSAKLLFLPTDRQGLKTGELLALAEKPDLIYLNPSQQQPGGAMLSLSRREELIAYATANNALIIEDDFDCEYLHTSAQQPSIQGLSKIDNVIYLGSFWNTLYPLINAGFMLIPKSLIETFEQAWHLTYHSFQTQFPSLEQATLAEFIEQGHLDRHLRSSSKIYSARWRALLHELNKEFSSSEIEISKEPSAFNLLLRFSPIFESEKLREAAIDADLPLLPCLEYYAFENSAKPNEFLIPFAQFDEEQIKSRVKTFAGIVKRVPLKQS